VREDEQDVDELLIHDAILAGAVFAADPANVGGIILHADSGPGRETWFQSVLSLLPIGAEVRRVPAHINDERLLGGLDLAATLAAGQPVIAPGLLREANGGIIVIPSAERLTPEIASRITAAMDLKLVSVQRDGSNLSSPTTFGIIAFDEGRSTDESPPSVLLDRAALHITLPYVRPTEMKFDKFTREQVSRAGRTAISAHLDDEALSLLCEMASVLGVPSSNALQHAVRISRILAALDGRDRVSEADIAATTRMIIAPRATRFPEEGEAPASPCAPTHSDQPPEHDPAEQEEAGRSADTLIAAAKAVLPPHLLDRLRSAHRPKVARASIGKSGVKKKSPCRGRPVGIKPGAISQGARLNIVETLRAAAPWQTFREREPDGDGNSTNLKRVTVRASDFRVWRLKTRGETVTVFVVDASGSTAMQRLGEAKGAVEILLSECYSRRDHAALIAFSGRGSELLLPPTRSLARAKRNLADLPGGGGTPLAAGISATIELCDAVRRKGQTPSVVLLTDGRANLSRDGKPGRARAEDDAVSAAQALRRMDIPALVIDTSARPNAPAARLAGALGARYLPLAHADAGTLSQVIKSRGDWSTSP
jgi:magnesium chelatase subunit D